MCSKLIFCSKIAEKGKNFSRLLEPQEVTPNAITHKLLLIEVVVTKKVETSLVSTGIELFFANATRELYLQQIPQKFFEVGVVCFLQEIKRFDNSV